jgi:seryl-tRNA synthetase
MLRNSLRYGSQLYVRHQRKAFVPTLNHCLRFKSTTVEQTEETDIHRIPPQLNLQYYADNTATIANNMKLRNYEPDCAYRVQELFLQHTKLEAKATQLRQERDQANQQIRDATDKQARTQFIAQAQGLKSQLLEIELQLSQVELELTTQALQIPNDTHPDTPLGPESNARIIKTVGQPRIQQQQPLEDHLTIAQRLNMVDFEQASKVTGSKFYYLKNYGVWLEFALIQYAFHKATARGFAPVLTPDIVRTSIAYGCGFQPRKKEASQIYDVTTPSTVNTSAPKLCLVGTAEIALAGLSAEKLYQEEELPKKMVGFSHAFRAEAGHGSAEERGLYRVHQFSKVELFTVTTPEQSESMMEELRSLQEDLFTELGLCFRILDMPTEELGASAYRKYDMEAWMPGKNGWGEVRTLICLL